ncbi:hypothetical protein [Halanaerobacter jeridensis]|uniref:Uncharacterized protein n=1 Tax=Halanaerobacter jeridensis TaxID=706427 RepID=A0A938XSY5_9FIRM|nr:hypothetical protein [Halanaerobacter jeridensis]MBM7556938.1 hypothetical protein [Halanaerobacter jeridensis]
MNSIWTKRQSKILVVLTLIVSLVGLVGCSDDDSGPKKFNVAGTVVSNDGQALAGITVTVEGGDTKTNTDTDGNWALTKVKKGKVIKAVNTDDYTFEGSHTVNANKTDIQFKANENKGTDDNNNEDGENDGLTVEIVDSTTIKVKSSDNEVEEIILEKELELGENEVTFEYNGKSYTKTVNYKDPGVESVELIDYRNLKVTYNTIVDHATASELDNYYININEGNAAYNSIDAIDLGASNRLSELSQSTIITTEVNDIDGRTVVDIYFPEDARFTNKKDQSTDDDDERTLEVQYAGNQIENKFLIKGETIEVAVRNVATKNGKLSIDTTVHEVYIKDEDHPTCKSMFVTGDYNTDNLGKVINFDGAVDRVIPTSEHAGNNVALKFDEPVFDSHDLQYKEDEDKVIRVWVNGEEIASSSGLDSEGEELASSLADVMKFNMSAADNYEKSSKAIVKIKDLLAAYATKTNQDLNAVYKIGESHTVKVSGIRDLAGNVMVKDMEVEFTVNLVDDEEIPDDGETQPEINHDTLPPMVKEIKQVADNIFRIKFVTGEDETYQGDETPGQPLANVTARFIIDGGEEDEGTIERNVPLSNEQGYSYVQVPAVDEQTTTDDVLCYRNNESIYRDITIANPWRVGEADIDDDGTQEEDIYLHEGENKLIDNFVIKKDVMSPIHDEFGSDSSYYPGRDVVDTEEEANSEGTKEDRTIVFEVKDRVPDNIPNNAHFKNPVVPVKYKYNAAEKEIIENETVALNDESGMYLPITVSCKKVDDEQGIVRKDVLLNKSTVDNTSENSKSVQFIAYQDGDGINRYKVKLDLTGYDDLLDNKGRLVDNATYTVKVPKGFFADAPQDDVFDLNDNDTGDYGDYVGEGSIDATPTDIIFEGNNYQETFNQDVGFEDPIFVADALEKLDNSRATVYERDTSTYSSVYDVLYVTDEKDKDLESEFYGHTSERFTFNFITPKDYIDGTDGTDGYTPDDDIDYNPEDEVPQTTKRLVNYNEELNEILVRFTGGVDPATLRDPNNYTIDGNTLAELGLDSADIEYGLQEIGSEFDSEEDEGSDQQFSMAVFEVPEGTISEDGVSAEVTIKGISNNFGGTMTPLTTELELLDNTQPRPTCTLTATDEIKLTFKEPVEYRDGAGQLSAADNFVVYYEAAPYPAMKAIIDEENDRRTLTITFSSVINADVDQIDTSKLSVKVKPDENDSILVIDDATLRNPVKVGEYPVTK